MKFLSGCSGIEAASLAWLPLGWSAVAYAEKAAFPSAVLAHHFPATPNLGDMTLFREWPDATLDVFIAGTPCQSFSIAGLRAGLSDPRGNLALTYLAIANRYRPMWLVWENTPGVLSVNDGRDFATFLSGLAKLGYGWGYRTLDAQYFRLPQRRRRVYVVGCAGGWAAAAAVLFELASLRGDPAPGRAARERSAFSPSSCIDGSSTEGIECAALISGTVSAKWRKGTGGPSGDECYNLIPFDTTQLTHPENRSSPKPGDPSPTLAGSGHAPAIAFNVDATSAQDPGVKTGRTLHAQLGDRGASAFANVGVRRLTPKECERLQGLPDDWTLVPFHGKPATDSPRYEAIGNAMAVPVVTWIGRRIELVQSVLDELLPRGAL